MTQKMTDARMKELRAYFRGQGPVERHGNELLAHIAALTAERDDSDRLARIRREELEKAERMLDARNEEIDALRERVHVLEKERDEARAAGIRAVNGLRSRLAAFRARLDDVVDGRAPARVLGWDKRTARYLVGEDDHAECSGCPTCWPTPTLPEAPKEQVDHGLCGPSTVQGRHKLGTNSEPTTAEAFATVRVRLERLRAVTNDEGADDALALLERRMERYTLAARMVVDATNDAQDMDEDLLAARLAAKAALADAPPAAKGEGQS